MQTDDRPKPHKRQSHAEIETPSAGEMNSVIACHINIGNDKLKQLGNAVNDIIAEGEDFDGTGH